MSADTSPTDPVADPVSRYKGTPSRARLVEIARFFLKLGFVGFGGPLVHIAMMEDELVGSGAEATGDADGRGAGWADEATFMDGLAICNMLPGPASTQLGIFMGWVRAGNPGALVAGATFMAPTFLIVLALSYVYFAYGELPSVAAFFYGVNPVVIGLIAGATISLSFGAILDGFTAALSLVAFVLFVRGVDAAYLIVGGGVLGAAVYLLVWPSGAACTADR